MEDLYIFGCPENGHVRYAPLHILHIKVAAEALGRKMQKMMAAAADCPMPENLRDKLWQLRYSKGLTQREAAKIAGLSLDVYCHLEQGVTKHISEEAAQRLSAFYGAPIMDERETAFVLFLTDDPAGRIQAYRESLGMKRSTFAKQMNIPVSSLRSWETGKKTISRQNWERYFADRI